MSLPLVPETGGRAEGQRAGATEPAGHQGAPAAKREAFPAPESGAARAPDGVTATLGEARGGVGTGEIREAALSGDRALRPTWPPRETPAWQAAEAPWGPGVHLAPRDGGSLLLRWAAARVASTAALSPTVRGSRLLEPRSARDPGPTADAGFSSKGN